MSPASKILALTLSLFCISICYAQESSIHFTSESWQQALATAKTTHKPIFLYGTSVSCHFCKEMERGVFPQKEVSEYFNTNFINIQLDLEKSPGDSLAKQYGIISFPAYVFFDKEGVFLHIAVGGKTAGEFIQDAKNAFVEDSAYAVLKARYDKGERTPALLYSYSNVLTATAAFNKLQTEVEQQYLQILDSNEMRSNKNLHYLFNHIGNGMNAPATKYYLQYYQALCEAFGSAEVRRQTTFLVEQEANSAAEKNDTAQLTVFKKTLSTYTGSQAVQLDKLADIKFAMTIFVNTKTKWKPYVQATDEYARDFINQDPYTLFETSSYLLAFGEDPKLLPEAARLIKKAIEVRKSYDYYLVLAKIYHKMGQEANAASTATTAVTVGTTNNTDTSDAKELLAEIKKGKSS